MKGFLRPTLVVTFFTLGGQAVGFVTQVVIAASFGARSDMDAFLAANTLPQYVIAVLLTALSFVFIPVFVDYLSTGQEDEAWRVAIGVTTLCILTLGVIAITGVIFAFPLLRLTMPGLSSPSLQLAVQVAIITWPTVVATGIVSLLASIYQAQGRFGRPAVVPVIGGTVNLGLVLLLVRPLGVVGLAIASLLSICLQAVLLFPFIFGPSRYRPALNWNHPGVRQVLHLLWPLVLSGLFIRATPIVDRYLASGLGEGAISHLGYAFKLLGLLATLISTGLTMVLFPRMAANIAESDVTGLRRTVSQGLRIMWLAIAPVTCIGAALALPVTTILLQRGEFRPTDTRAVASLLQIYLLSLAGMCLGSITGRSLYALKETRIVAVLSSLEALAYVLYTPLLTRLLGAEGVALSYVIYFTPGVLWSAILIRFKTGNKGGGLIISSFVRIGLAAMLGGATAWGVMATIPNVWAQVFFGGGLGLVIYAFGLWALRSPEARSIEGILRGLIEGRRAAVVPDP